MGFAHLHVSHKYPHHKKRAHSGDCNNGGFTNPTLGQTINSLNPLNISWDQSCLSNVQSIDIILSAPGKPLQGWQSVNFATGYKVVNLNPSKWNNTASQQLQLSLYQSGTPSFMSPLPAGPVFTATYTAPKGLGAVSNSSSHGKVAAGVLVPLIFIGIGIFVYIKYQRLVSKEKRKRWSEAVDKRMSTISTDWKSMSAAGAQAAIRHSMATSNRNSAFSFGAIRPSSQLVVEPTAPDMAQIRRPGTGLRNAALANSTASGERVSRVSFADTTRVSRVSFANDPRPSIESRRTFGSSRPSRAFHSAYAPPVPELPAAYSPTEKTAHEVVDVNLSPRQTAGPLSLSPEDIRARLQSGRIDQDEDGIADVLPALALMRTGSRSSANRSFSHATSPSSDMSLAHGDADDYIISLANPFMGEVTDMPEMDYYTQADMSSTMPPTSFSPPPPQGSPAMSPDDMLRAYAERRATRAPSYRGSSPGARLEKHSSLIGNFATALKNRKKKDRDSRTGTPANGTKPMTIVTNNMGYPVTEQDAERQEASSVDSHYSRMEGIGVGSHSGGAHYAIGEDEEHVYAGTAQ